MASRFLEQLEALLPVSGDFERLMQGTPVYPDVWRRFAELAATSEGPNARVDVLLNPHRQNSAIDLFCALTVRLYHCGGKPADPQWLEPYKLSTSETHVAARLTLTELVCVALPLTKWWQKHAAQSPEGQPEPLGTYLRNLAEQVGGRAKLGTALAEQQSTNVTASSLTSDGRWFFAILGLIAWRMGVKNDKTVSARTCTRKAAAIVLDAQEESNEPMLWGVSCNREIQSAVWKSVPAIKADAARGLFNLDASDIAWAVIDSGIDATHEAFRKRDREGTPLGKSFVRSQTLAAENQTRVVETYDFTRLRKTLALKASDLPKNISEIAGTFDEQANGLRKALAGGRFIDWAQIHEQVRIDYDPDDLAESIPGNAHGTHVAGILAADWPQSPRKRIAGVCPGLRLYDLRVVDDDGVGDEFSILAAIDFVRHRNATSEHPIIHGVNISMSIAHDVRGYACGRTPVCEACDRLVANGVVVVTAAGNRGYAQFRDEQGRASMGYRSSGITDPGNCESAITVGATHRNKPHQYGVSFFSSRGPTGDGRIKPDLVAPGEKINAPVPGDDQEARDGTSMAAPHVSGAAALLMARYSELIGDPQRIKKILCETATDLGRERYFQGAGMLDILRALQSV